MVFVLDLIDILFANHLAQKVGNLKAGLNYSTVLAKSGEIYLSSLNII